MRAEEKDGTVLVKGVLRPVAVMDVPIDDENLREAVMALGVTRGDGNVVEDTDAHALVGASVVAGRSDAAECIGRNSGYEGTEGVEQAYRRMERDVVGMLADVGVAG